MKRLIQCAIMIALLAGFQGMAVDVTCLVLWHADDLEAGHQDIGAHFNHHPDAPAAHQTASDGEATSLDGGTMLDQVASVSASVLLPEPQSVGASLSPSQLYFLSTHSRSISNPPEYVVFL